MEAKAIDSLDRDILNALEEDARRSLRQIAKRVQASVTTVMNRLKRLEQTGVVTGYSARVNYDRLGYEFDALIDISVSKGKLLQVEQKIASHPNVYAVYDITGASDVTVMARFKTRKGLDDFLKKIQTYDFVEDTHTHLVLRTIKDHKMLV